MNKHAPLAPSAAYRWIKCPGSIRMSEGLVPPETVYAREGTIAHLVAEKCLKKNKPAKFFIGKKLVEEPGAVPVEVTEDMAAAVQEYLDYVVECQKEGAHEIEIEAKVRFSDNVYGTGDALLYYPENAFLRVIDYKHGAGIPVEVSSNPQLLLYAIGAALRKSNRPLKAVEIVIVQPRCPHPDGAIRKWKLDAVDLLDWAADITEAVEATQDPDAPLNPGHWCRFCPAAAICPALKKKVQSIAKDEFKEGDMYDPKVLKQALDNLSLLKAYIKSVEEFAFSEACEGRCPNGWKLVEKRKTRKWKSEEKTIGRLRKLGLKLGEIQDVRLKSPAQVEKLLDKDMRKKISPLVESRSSGLTLAPENDKRPPARPEAAKEFSQV